jgi:anti-sigma factor RsiW
MSCRFRDNLTAYLDGELGSSETQELRLHIESCAECRSYATLLMRSYEALDSIVSPAVSGDFAAGVRARTRPRILKPVRAFAALAAAAVVILAITVRLNTTVDVRPASSEIDLIAVEVIASLEADSAADAFEVVDTFDILAGVDDLDEQELYGALEAVEEFGPGAVNATI